VPESKQHVLRIGIDAPLSQRPGVDLPDRRDRVYESVSGIKEDAVDVQRSLPLTKASGRNLQRFSRARHYSDEVAEALTKRTAEIAEDAEAVPETGS
jgi:hypothetical protein